ncbi:MAG: hypothetical protein ACRDBL_03605 [Rhabdaerophilum sp.]
MRAITLAAASVALLCLAIGAQAQTQRKNLYIEVQPRSWLDAGKAYEPGASHNYVYDMMGSSGGMPTGGRASSFGLLPDRFSSGAPIKVDIPAPDFLRK